MIRVVLDANVLASGLVGESKAPGLLMTQWRENGFTLVMSDHILAGTARTLTKPYFVKRLPPARANAELKRLELQSARVVPDPDVRGIADDEEDDLVLATAVAGQAGYLVTGDKGLLAIATYRDVRILTSRNLLDLLLLELDVE